MALLSSGVCLSQLRLLKIIYFPPTDGVFISLRPMLLYACSARLNFTQKHPDISFLLPSYWKQSSKMMPTFPFLHRATVYLNTKSAAVTCSPLWMNNSSVTFYLWKVSQFSLMNKTSLSIVIQASVFNDCCATNRCADDCAHTHHIVSDVMVYMLTNGEMGWNGRLQDAEVRGEVRGVLHVKCALAANLLLSCALWRRANRSSVVGRVF